MDQASDYRRRHENHLRRVVGGLSNSLAWLAAVENVLSGGGFRACGAPNREQTHCVGQSVISADTLTHGVNDKSWPRGWSHAGSGAPGPSSLRRAGALTPIRTLPISRMGFRAAP
jgi:hypothetical protein